MKEKKHTSFVLHHDFESMFRRLPMEERGMLITAIFEYCVRGHETEELSDATGMAFCCIKQVLERDQAAYEERCKVNSENGKKGGRPQKNTSPVKSDWFSQKAKKGDSDSDNDDKLNGSWHLLSDIYINY